LTARQKINVNWKERQPSDIAIQLWHVKVYIFPLQRLNSHSRASYSHFLSMADRIPIPVGIPWDLWDSGLSHSHAHLYHSRRCWPSAVISW